MVRTPCFDGSLLPEKSQRQINRLAKPFLLMEIIVSCVLFKPLLTPKTHCALVDKSQGQIDTMLAHLLPDLAGLASAAGNQCLMVLFKPGQASAAGSRKKLELFFSALPPNTQTPSGQMKNIAK